MEKTCKKCGQTKDIGLFNRSKSNKDGLKIWCKSCDSAYYQSWYQANQDEKLEYVGKWQKNHKMKVRATSKRYRANKKLRKLHINPDFIPLDGLGETSVPVA